MKTQFGKHIFCFFIIFCTVTISHSEIKHWANNSGNSNFGTDTNWVPFGAPTAADTAFVDSGKGYCAVGANNSVARVIIPYGGRLVVRKSDNGKSLTILGDIIVESGGTFNTAGSPGANGPVIYITGNIVNYGVWDLRGVGIANAGVVMNGIGQSITSNSGLFFQNMVTIDTVMVIGPSITVNGNYSGPPISYNNSIDSTTVVQLQSGWNLVSVDRILSDYRSSMIFPSAMPGRVYGFANGALSSRDTLENGKGYWAYCFSNDSTVLHGDSLNTYTITVTSGNEWILIGSLTQSVPVTSLQSSPPSAILAGSIFSYTNNDYVSPTLIEPGKGYWMFVTQPCIISVTPQ